MKNHTNKHTFSFYFKNIEETIQEKKIGDIIIIRNKELLFRIKNILRLKKNDELFIFNQKIHIKLQLIQFLKQNLSCLILSINKNKTLKPIINFILPNLNKKDFEASIYSLVELGASKIYLTTSKKSKKIIINKERIKKIIITAAEQSKNFAFPEFSYNIENFQEIILKLKGLKILFDPSGINLSYLIKNLNCKNEMNIMVGPEGGLTLEEKLMLKKHNFILCRLTPTILRSSEAVILSLGILRSFC